jgi:hypothetical protein
MSELQNGRTYRVVAQRKGTFTARVEHFDDTWATLTIVSGRARAMLPYNEREAGEEVTVRRSHTTFTEITDPCSAEGSDA